MTTKKGTLLILSGPSGAGKSTVIRRVMEQRKNIYFSVSCTTRDPRPGEVNGVNYHFITNSEFEEMIAGDAFLEYAGYVSNYYGTPKQPILHHLSMGWDVILDIEVQGADIVRGKLPETVACFMMPPSFEELERRLCSRGSDDEQTIQKRLKRARTEIQSIDRYDYLVINDDVDVAAGQILAILQASECRVSQCEYQF